MDGATRLFARDRDIYGRSVARISYLTMIHTRIFGYRPPHHEILEIRHFNVMRFFATMPFRHN